MKIAFFGDVHGCVLHALGAAVMLQRRRGLRLDAVVQVGDLGAFPSPDRMDESSRRLAESDPAQGDLLRLLDPPPSLAAAVRRALEEIPAFQFVSGNHEDHDWLAAVHEAAGAPVVAPIDPLGAFRHVACGSVVQVAGRRMAFLGLIESESMDFDPDAYAALMAAEPGSVDVLVTHDGPYAMSEYRGVVQGSAKMTRLIEHLQPRLHVSGHYHHENGPRHYGATTSYALSQLVYPRFARDATPLNPAQQVMPGSIGLLDTDTYAFEYIHDPWLAEVKGHPLNLADLLA
ncbi:metallophosphoesterase [Actinomadura miaoliensis]|uniref:Calcineurin-like phosphoesterase domain-containing protein n=1 Tax=Actinomadura miaoliensis TaxID=430685 RepID=A0ABP7WX37_9ACTN